MCTTGCATNELSEERSEDPLSVLESIERELEKRANELRKTLQSDLIEEAEPKEEPTIAYGFLPSVISQAAVVSDEEFRTFAYPPLPRSISVGLPNHLPLSPVPMSPSSQKRSQLDYILALCDDLPDEEVEELIELLLEKRVDRVNPKPLKEARKQQKKSDKRWKESKSRVDRLNKRLDGSRQTRQRLENQITSAGLQVADDIPYETCVSKMEELQRSLNELHPDSELEDRHEHFKRRSQYFRLQKEYSRYKFALILTPEYKEEQKRKEEEWELSTFKDPLNEQALRNLRKHIPVNVRSLTVEELVSPGSNNREGKPLPHEIATKLKQTNVLQLLRVDPVAIENMHAVELESLDTSPLSLTERRALYMHFRAIAKTWLTTGKAGDPVVERKQAWYSANIFDPFKKSLKECNTKDTDHSNLDPAHDTSSATDADAGSIDYSAHDYGYPQGPVYEASVETLMEEAPQVQTDQCKIEDVQSALQENRLSFREKRAAQLEKHYRGKYNQVERAQAFCESMDLTMDKLELRLLKGCQVIVDLTWDQEGTISDNSLSTVHMSEVSKKKHLIRFKEALNDIKSDLVNMCKLSGVQVAGSKRKSKVALDGRSAVECGLTEEVCEAVDEYLDFLEAQLHDMDVRDAQISRTVARVEDLCIDLHAQNRSTLSKTLKKDCPKRSRPLKTKDDFIELAISEHEARMEAERVKRQEQEAEALLLMKQKKKRAIKRKLTGKPIAIYPLFAAIQKRRRKSAEKRPSRGGIANVIAAIASRSN